MPVAGQKTGGASAEGEKSRIELGPQLQAFGASLAWAILRGQSFKKIFGQEKLPRHCVYWVGAIKTGQRRG